MKYRFQKGHLIWGRHGWIVLFFMWSWSCASAQAPNLQLAYTGPLCLNGLTTVKANVGVAVPDSFVRYLAIDINGQNLNWTLGASSNIAIFVLPTGLPCGVNNAVTVTVVEKNTVSHVLDTITLTQGLNLICPPAVTYPGGIYCNAPSNTILPTISPLSANLAFVVSGNSVINASNGTLYGVGQLGAAIVQWTSAGTCIYHGLDTVYFHAPSAHAVLTYGATSVCIRPATVVAAPMANPGGGLFSITPNSGLMIDSHTGSITTSANTPAGNYYVTYVPPIGSCSLAVAATLVLQDDSVRIQCPTDSFCTGSGWTQPPTVLYGATSASSGYYVCPGVGFPAFDSVSGTLNTDLVGPGTYVLMFQTRGNPCMRRYLVDGAIHVLKTPDASFDYPESAYCNTADTIAPSSGFEPGGLFMCSNVALSVDTITGEVDGLLSSPGGYLISHQMGNHGHCMVTETDSITILMRDTLTHIQADQPAYCGGDTITVTVQGNVSGHWSASPSGMDLILPSTVPGQFLGSTGGTYLLEYSGFGACGEVASTAVVINSPAWDSLSYAPFAPIYCDRADTLRPEIFPASMVGKYSADSGAVILPDGSIDVQATGAGVFWIKFQPEDCYEVARFRLEISETPSDTLSPEILPAYICAGTSVTINHYDGYRHRLALNGQFLTTANSYVLDSVPEGAELLVEYINVAGCSTDTTILLEVHDHPHAVLYPGDSTFHVSQTMLVVTATSDVPTVLTWHAEVANGVLTPFSGNDTISSSPLAINLLPEMFSPDSIMHIWLSFGSETAGCAANLDTVHYLILPEASPAIYIPGAFSPNGDGLNDTWLIAIPEERASEYSGYKIDVLNRAGVLVKTLDITNASWDASGLPDAVYLYVLKDAKQDFVQRGMVTVNRTPETN